MVVAHEGRRYTEPQNALMVQSCLASPVSDSSVGHNCGLFGVYGQEDAVFLTQLGLYALQHRGQESAGIVSSDGEVLMRHVGMGLVSQVFDAGSLERLRGRTAIGHVRYSTTGASTAANSQPLVFSFAGGQVAIGTTATLSTRRCYAATTRKSDISFRRPATPR